MANIHDNGQTCLEKRGIAERQEEMKRSDYNMNDPYSATHKDALSTGDPQGKGSGSGGHSHYLPDCTKPTTTIDYSNFDTNPSDNIGGQYDIEGRCGIPGRKEQMARSIYNHLTPYGPNLVNTELNRADGQYYIGQQLIQGCS